MIERRNDYVQARGRYNTIMEWERDDLVKNLGDLLNQCERDVQERMVWHLLLVHDDYGARVGQALNITADDVRHLEPLPGQVLTNEDNQRLANLGHNGDVIDAAPWGIWTGSVKDYQASAEEVLGGMMVPIA
ncbi:MAG: catalase [Chlorobi bacterium]|nr:catalase [Chlorobiota bacterium]